MRIVREHEGAKGSVKPINQRRTREGDEGLHRAEQKEGATEYFGANRKPLDFLLAAQGRETTSAVKRGISMKRVFHWFFLVFSSAIFLVVLGVFFWENFMNIIALVIMCCLAVAIIRHAQDLGLLER